MRFRLRYLQHDMELSEGHFVIGRSVGCQLSLDDPLVSRRHAVLLVAGDTVSIDDQGSRNGVLVNGVRIPGKALLQPGDRIMIGSQEITLLGPASERPEFVGRALKQTLTRIPSPPPPPPPAPDLDGGSGRPAPDTDADTTMVRRIQAFTMLSGVAEKALAMGRSEEAERLVAGPLSELVEACRAGKALSPSLVDVVARFAARLATATAKGTWADYVIELYQAQGRPCPAPVVDELNNAVRKVTALDLVRLRDYLTLLHEKQAAFGPAERFLLQRLEGLERIAALR